MTRQIDYRRRALDEVLLEGYLTLSELPRTREVVVADSGAPVDVRLVFNEDAQRRVVLTGRVQTTLVLACQRCLQPTEKAIDADVAGIVVAGDEAAAAVPRAWEPILAEGDMLDVHALVDDELLLALPMTVQCDRPQCRAAYDNDTEQETPEDRPAREKPNPFAALASLKRDDDRSR
ncbi:YceD family protein [Salinisphaera sp.]|uniref:YceD family protein n=1 Tax=Salinisphaera sp. TaxID=1914330 RepID=UPI002D7A0D06|nr:YceD family protein [Salinisphaera sp.]HET7314719.1 YceD family protein [Salinisphaera sp.]